MKEQPEALRLAEFLEMHWCNVDMPEAKAAAELRRLAKVEDEWAALSQDQGKLESQIDRLETQRDALLEALKEYGWHHEGCPQYPTYTHPDRWPACTCGFDDAIKAVEEEQK